MERKMRTFEEYLVEELRDEKNAKGFLEVILEEYKKDHELTILLHSMRSIAIAKGGILQLGDSLKVDQNGLDVLLTEESNPSWEQVLKALGYSLLLVSTEPVPSY